MKPEYDVALSFAGEDRSYVRSVADSLTGRGVRSFFDEYETATLWGKDLYQHLDDVYRHKARFCVVFVSEAYARKLWTRHELRSAQARAFADATEYILPARFDDTELPGMPTTLGYIDLRRTTPTQLAELVLLKLSGGGTPSRPSTPSSSAIHPLNQHTHSPRRAQLTRATLRPLDSKEE